MNVDRTHSTLHRVSAPSAVFGVWVDENGNIEANPEIGWTMTYGTLAALTEAVERQGGSIEKSPSPKKVVDI